MNREWVSSPIRSKSSKSIRVRSMDDRPQVSRWYINKGIDSPRVPKGHPFRWHKTPEKRGTWSHLSHVALRFGSSAAYSFVGRKCEATRGCDYRTVTEKFSRPVLYFYVNVGGPARRSVILFRRVEHHSCSRGFRCEPTDRRIITLPLSRSSIVILFPHRHLFASI